MVIASFSPDLALAGKEVSKGTTATATVDTSNCKAKSLSKQGFSLFLGNSKSEKIKDTTESPEVMSLLMGYINGNISYKDLMIKINSLGEAESQGIKALVDLKNIIDNITKNTDVNISNLQVSLDKLSTSQGNEELTKLLNSIITTSKDTTLKNEDFTDLLPKIIKNYLLDNSQLSKANVNTKSSDTTDNEASNIQASLVDTKSTAVNSTITTLMSKVDALKKEIETLTWNNKDTTAEAKTNDLPITIVTSLTKNTMTSNNDQESTQNDDTDKGNKLLKGLTSTDNNDYQNKVSSFMTHLNLAKETQVSNLTDKVTVSKDSFVPDVIKAVKYMEINNVKDLSVKISPEDLGELVIKVTMEQGVMKVNITASNKETVNLLNASINNIKENLHNQEISVQNFGVDISNGDTTFFRDNSPKENGKQNKNTGKDIVDDLSTQGIDSIINSQEGNVNILV